MKKSRKVLRDFEITRFKRRYDKQTGKFVYNIAYQTVTEITARTIDVAEAFGLGVDETREYVIYENFELKLGPTDIIYITGDSGSGKSVLLRELKKDLSTCNNGKQVTDVTDVTVDPDKPLIDQVGKDTKEGLMLLSHVGLGDAFLFIRRYRELSDGQKYRFRLAKLIEGDCQYWFADEFCATLDRDTAKIVAYNVQKQARRLGRAVIVATTHTDLFDDLKPSVHIHKGLGKEVELNYYPNEINPRCSLLREMTIQEGSRADYAKLAIYHYRMTHTRFPISKVFTLKRGKQLAGAIVYMPTAIAAQGRRQIFGRRLSIQEINQFLTKIARVVVHPKYRSIGAGVKIVKETLPICGRPYVECIAVMAQYNPFLEKAGMRKILITKPQKEVIEGIKQLEKLGFNPVHLASEKLNMRRLTQLCESEVENVKSILKTMGGASRKRIIGGGKAWYTKKEYQDLIDCASISGLTRMLSILAVLSQPKVYLFWQHQKKNPLKI